MVSLAGISTNPAKLEAIEHWPTPQDAGDARSGLGMSGYCHKFVEDYSKSARSLTCLTEKDVDFVWDEAEDEVWNIFKEELLKAPPILS